MQDLSPPDDDRAVGPLAPYGTRLFGYVVDAIIVYGLVGVVVLEVLREPTRLITISAALAGLIYASILVALWGGATAGMHVAQVRCVNGQTLGAVTWPRSLGRAAIHAVLLIVRILEQGELPGDTALIGSMVRRISFENARGFLGLEVDPSFG